MVRVATLSSPFLLGFDEIERAIDKVSRAASDGYPPYNIERIIGNGEPDRLRISLAVAGFAQEQIEVTQEGNQLLICGRQDEDKDRQYLHRGISARRFHRSFVLAEGMQVLGAKLGDGLLSIDMARPNPERKTKKINIVSRDEQFAEQACPKGQP